jgi:hypothetical protein
MFLVMTFVTSFNSSFSLSRFCVARLSWYVFLVWRKPIRTSIPLGAIAKAVRLAVGLRENGHVFELPARLFEQLPFAIYICDRDGLVLRFNRRAAELWGRSPKLADPNERFCGSYRFKQSGQGETAESWVKMGPNKPCTPAQLEQAIGPEVLDTLSKQTGLAREELLSRLCRELPDAVDKYTPQGRLPTEAELSRA